MNKTVKKFEITYNTLKVKFGIETVWTFTNYHGSII
jgi:hypothetical protein